MKEIQDYIEILAKEYKLPSHVVEKIFTSQFKFVAETMKEGNFDSVRLQYLGVFGVKPARLRHIEENIKRGQVKRDLSGLEEPYVEEPGDRDDSEEKSNDLLDLR